jgi:hypothetical protein
MVLVTFTWDIPEGERLVRAWKAYFEDVRIGGPAFNDPGDEFTPGMFVKQGVVVTSRGCPKAFSFCLVPQREGRIRELQIKDGWNVFDNNLLACSRPHIEAVFEMLQRQPEPAHFTGGLDKTLLEPRHIDLLKSIRLKRAWFACDSKAGFPALERAADLLSDFSRGEEILLCAGGLSPGNAGGSRGQADADFRFGLHALLYALPGPGDSLPDAPGSGVEEACP